MSVEQPLWRAVTAYRLVTLAYAIGQFAVAYGKFKHPLGAAAYLAFLTVWTILTLGHVSSAERCTKRFLVADLTIALAGILLTPVVDTHQRIIDGATTLPSIWTAGSVLAFAVKGGWRPAAVASTLVGIADLIERGAFSRETVHNVVLVWISSIAIGYVVEVARASERVLARALQIEAATRERDRLARDIHDSVLQVLAMVQRRGAEIGGEAEALGRMAGEQEVALRSLVSDSPVPDPRRPDEVAAVRRGRLLAGLLRSGTGGAAPVGTDAGGAEASGPADLRPLLTAYGSAQVTVSAPATPVLVSAHAAGEIAAAVGAALDNVAKHVGDGAHAWVLLEDEPDAILVSVRDDGPGIPDGRLADAEREGRLGVAQSIRGRLSDLGGTAELISVPGQGTEVELRIPREGGKTR
jgi:signal transduction histidine kinase